MKEMFNDKGYVLALQSKDKAQAEYKQKLIKRIEELKDTKNMIKVCDEYSDDLDERIHFDDGFNQALDEVEAVIREE